ncbi:MAG: adenine phosphoribosyltransferase [Bacteroidales bacterium]|nr:adenine phosphoribosyltransferase [Bacteroidales bacterium]
MHPVITQKDLEDSIRTIPDFPKPGIQFKDITTAIKDPDIFNYIVDNIVEYYKNKGITKVVAIESRGFIAGGAIASRLNAGFIPVRKPGKLPSETYSVNYSLEYGEGILEIHKDALKQNDIVMIHDDLLATGGTSLAVIELIRKFGISKIFLGYIIELDFLQGKKKLEPYPKYSLIHF